jgi:hypothetical protein
MFIWIVVLMRTAVICLTSVSRHGVLRRGVVQNLGLRRVPVPSVFIQIKL